MRKDIVLFITITFHSYWKKKVRNMSVLILRISLKLVKVWMSARRQSRELQPLLLPTDQLH